MSIYKVLPYVYQCVHKTTGKIYIGSRTSKYQKLPPHLDLPKYRTSSNYVRPIFEEFYWHIVAEFFDPKDAYNFEQELIHEQWQVSKEMSLNKVCYYGKESWNTIGSTYNHTEETKRKIGNALKGRPISEEHGRKIGDAQRGKSKIFSEQRNMKISDSHKGISLSESHSNRIKESKRVEHSFLTPYGFVIENTTMSELCSQFNLNYNSISAYFRNNKSYKGFVRLD